jgi:hypothetical protein
MNRLSVIGGSSGYAEYRSHYDHGAVTLGDPQERTSE